MAGRYNGRQQKILERKKKICKIYSIHWSLLKFGWPLSYLIDAINLLIVALMLIVVLMQ